MRGRFARHVLYQTHLPYSLPIEGVEDRDEACILVAVIYRWERAPEEAASQKATALERFGEVSRKQKSVENRFNRISERMAGGLGPPAAGSARASGR